MNFKKYGANFLSLLLAVTMLFAFYPASATTTESDTTPPAFASGYPRAGAPQTVGTRQIRVVIGAQEPAYHTFIVLNNGAAAPTKSQVAAGLDADGNPALVVRSSGASKYDSIDTGTYVPLHGTDYDVYVVLRDGAGNVSEPAKVDVVSPPAGDFFAAGYPKAGAVQAVGSKQVQVLVKIQNTQVDGKVFYVLVPDGDPAPTLEQICAGKGGTGEPPVSSGSMTAAKGNECSFTVTGDADAADYDLYMLAGDTYYASPLGSCTNVVKLDIATPAALPGVCAIGSTEYPTLNDALAAVMSGQTIQLRANINYDSGIDVDGKSITFDLNGFTLNVDNLDPNIMNGAGLFVRNGGGVVLIGDGKLNVKGIHYGVFITSNSQPASATVSSAMASGIEGNGVYAYGQAAVTVLGDVTATGTNSIGAYVFEGANITVKGNVTGAVIGAYTTNSTITVEGNVIANGVNHPDTGEKTGNGVGAQGGIAVVLGDVIANNIGAGAWNGGSVTIDGSVTALKYIELEGSIIGIDDSQATTTKTGYRTYAYQGEEYTSTVWVKEIAAPVYVLTVENGSGSGSYEAGASVSITAGAAPSGKVFDHWSTEDGGTFANAVSASTTFTMPAAAATVTAVYRTLDVYTITVAAGKGGHISPNGTVSVAEGGSQSFSITPDSGYRIESVTVDGVGKGAVSSYAFSNVTDDHTINVVFAAVKSESPATGDSSRVSLWWFVLSILIPGAVMTMTKRIRVRKGSGE